MGLVTYNPTSPGRRFLITTDRSDLWKGKPVKTLTELRVQLDARPVSTPNARQETFWLAFADGQVVERRLADGKVVRTLPAGRSVADGPWLLGEQLVLLTPDGSLTTLPTAAETRGRE